MKQQSRIQFANEKVKKAFEELKNCKICEKDLYKHLVRAFKDIEENAFCGIQVQKRLIPKGYIKKYGIKNLWKYNLPDAWRLIYSIEANEVLVISIVLEWIDHKEYERIFGY